MEVTLQDIAQELDISAATVSRSLRHDTLIRPETRARVNEVAQRLGYKTRPRRPRRVMESDTTHQTLGLLLRHNSLVEARQDGNLMKMMTGVMATTDANRIQLQIHTVRYDETRHMAEDPLVIPPMARPGVCQAFIIHGEQDERDVAFLAGLAPVVTMVRQYRTLGVDAAVGDNIEGVRALVAHLVELGHRRLAWVSTGISPSFILEARQAGFIQGCLEHKLEFTPHSFFGPELYGGPSVRDKDAVSTALNSRVTAFVCSNDAVSLRVIQVLEDAGQRIPRDVSVTGFDASTHPGRERQPTSIDPHFFEIGQVAAQLAIQRITQPMTHPCVVSVHGAIVQGDTTGPAQGASTSQIAR